MENSFSGRSAGAIASSYSGYRDQWTFQGREWFIYLPFFVLVISFIGVCLQVASFWPWSSVIHEDGQRTLLGTIFYFEHALRELPLDILLGMAVAGSFAYHYPLACSEDVNFRRAPMLCRTGLSLLATIALIAGGTAMQGGLNAVIQNISQLHTRPGAVLVWGIHWRYHLLERLALILLGFALVGAHRSLLLASSRSFAYGRISLFAFALSLFAGLTAMFGLNSDPFRDAIFLGHQAREIFTHALVTVPLAVAGCLWVTEQVVMPPLRGNENRHGLVYAAASLGCLLTLYVVVGAFFTGAGSKAQTGNLTAVVLGHFFEHAFTYLVTPLTAVVFYLWSAGPSRR